MGGSTFWLAYKGIPRAAVLDRLKLQPATEPDPEIFGTELPGDWYLVMGIGLNFIDDTIMNRVCSDCLGVSCYLATSAMISGAAGWGNGRRMWSVIHDGEQNIDLQTEGELPSVYGQIRDPLMEKQNAQGDRPRVDYLFDVPIELAAATGFHGDRGTSAGYPDLEPLELSELPQLPTEWWLQPARPESWFTRYFG